MARIPWPGACAIRASTCAIRAPTCAIRGKVCAILAIDGDFFYLCDCMTDY